MIGPGAISGRPHDPSPAGFFELNIDSMTSLKRTFLKVLAVLFASAAPSAWAHPGHDLFDGGIRHAVASPNHLLVLTLFGLMLAGFGLVAQHKLARKVMVTAGAFAVVCAAVLRTVL
jgi:hypothetical protein